MSANLDLVRSFYADWERGDYSRADWADPEIECVVVNELQPGTFTGLAGLAAAMHTIFREFEDVRTEAEEYRELDGNVLVLTRLFGRES